MIPRDSAVSIVALLEKALDDVLEALACARTAPSGEFEAYIDRLAPATVNAAAILSIIYEEHPELRPGGPEMAEPVGFDGGKESTKGEALTASRPLDAEALERMRANLQNALVPFAEAVSAAARSVEIDQSQRAGIEGRLSEAQESVRSALEHIATQLGTTS